MTAVEVNILSIVRAFDEVSSPIERLLRHANDKANGNERIQFILDTDFFYHVQAYIKTGIEFPDDERIFKMQGITVVSQHCKLFLDEGINPIIGFCQLPCTTLVLNSRIKAFSANALQDEVILKALMRSSATS
ncbi:hypothetical protein CEP54_002141 [Fusarium duplospermum]|uniref:Uncharacterized protein n=1 Tax=Fusarium duplospermum TaxID=1325734 RepID=A0A428QWF2_9HYPO|nr:hypothetical protein CEP54_002141 [Fusarium duplospermum]